MLRFDRASVAHGGHLLLEAVSLHVRPGEAWALIGPSGAGKSVLLAAAATAVPLHAGDIVVCGHSVRREPEAVRHAVGYVPDRMPEWPSIRVAEFLELFASAAGLRGAPLAQAIERGSSMAGLGGRQGDRVDLLDTGHAKRLLVAKALIHSPEVLLLDDPFSGLDPAGQHGLQQVIGDAILMGRSLLVAIDDARVPECFTHVAMVREGQLWAAGTNDPATFSDGRQWRYVVRCSGRAEELAAMLRSSGMDSSPVDATAVRVWLDLAFAAPADVVVIAARAGFSVDWSGFDPPWQAQVVGGDWS